MENFIGELNYANLPFVSINLALRKIVQPKTFLWIFLIPVSNVYQIWCTKWCKRLVCAPCTLSLSGIVDFIATSGSTMWSASVAQLIWGVYAGFNWVNRNIDGEAYFGIGMKGMNEEHPCLHENIHWWYQEMMSRNMHFWRWNVIRTWYMHQYW